MDKSYGAAGGQGLRDTQAGDVATKQRGSRTRQTVFRQQAAKVFAGAVAAPGGVARVSKLCEGAATA